MECVKQAEEFISLAETTSDPELKEEYLKLAGNLTRVASMLDQEPDGEYPRQEAQAGSSEKTVVPGEKHRLKAP